MPPGGCGSACVFRAARGHNEGYTALMRVSVIIPSLGAAPLEACLQALLRQTRAPDETLVVLSGGGEMPPGAPGVKVLSSPGRLGFAAAVNRGLGEIDDATEAVALLNDDAIPAPEWLEGLMQALEEAPECGAVQGTVLDGEGRRVDGRGIAMDRFALPVQRDHGRILQEEESGGGEILGVSGTAALYRREALDAVRLADGKILDESFDSYHEDVDLALRLHRMGWSSWWRCGASCLHLGSMTGGKRSFLHPWWILSNRWRVLASNFSGTFLLWNLPRLLRGEIRAILSLGRTNPWTFPVAPAVWAALPWIVFRSLRRASPGPRLHRFQEFSR